MFTSHVAQQSEHLCRCRVFTSRVNSTFRPAKRASLSISHVHITCQLSTSHVAQQANQVSEQGIRGRSQVVLCVAGAVLDLSVHLRCRPGRGHLREHLSQYQMSLEKVSERLWQHRMSTSPVTQQSMRASLATSHHQHRISVNKVSEHRCRY